MELKNLKLDFLWEKNPHNWLGKANPYTEKWSSEIVKLYNFIEEAPLQKLITLLLIAYKDKYPKEHYWIFRSQSAPLPRESFHRYRANPLLPRESFRVVIKKSPLPRESFRVAIKKSVLVKN